jgi:hypothetical protein
MSPVVLSLLVFVLLLLTLALFARGGAGETVRMIEPRTRLPEDLAKHAPRLLRALGLSVDRVETAANGVTEISAHRDGPVVGHRLSLRLLPREAGPVGASEVQTAVDAARGEGLHKVVIVSPAGFSDEAMSAAIDAPVELMTAARFVELDAALARTVARKGDRLLFDAPT